MRAFAAAVLLAVATLGVALALKNPVEVLGGGGCPTRRYAGVYCPGCGSLRATHYMLNGHAAEAWRHNPLMVAVGFPCAAMLVVVYGGVLVTGRLGPSRFAARAWVLWAAAAGLLTWGVLRNVPVRSLDWTRPPEPGAASRTHDAQQPA